MVPVPLTISATSTNTFVNWLASLVDLVNTTNTLVLVLRSFLNSLMSETSSSAFCPAFFAWSGLKQRATTSQTRTWHTGESFHTNSQFSFEISTFLHSKYLRKFLECSWLTVGRWKLHEITKNRRGPYNSRNWLPSANVIIWTALLQRHLAAYLVNSGLYRANLHPCIPSSSLIN